MHVVGERERGGGGEERSLESYKPMGFEDHHIDFIVRISVNSRLQNATILYSCST